MEIAHALGIPTAYIEKAVESLVESELMQRKGNKVYTDFLITSPEEKLKYLETEIEFAELGNFLNDYISKSSLK